MVETERRVVLVTAGASGIGRAIARKFLGLGCAVHVCDIDSAALNAFLEENPGSTGGLADVAESAAVDGLFDAFSARYGRLDVLVNNAGIAGPVAPLEAIEPADWERTLAVDLNGVFYVTRRAIPWLRKGATRCIVNIGSTAGLYGCPLRTPYVSAKWALVGLTKSLAMELGPEGMRVNVICPGSVDGERIDRVIRAEALRRGLEPETVRGGFTRQVSLRRFVTADEVADLACYLASDAGRTVSGQALAIDGHTESLAHDL